MLKRFIVVKLKLILYDWKSFNMSNFEQFKENIDKLALNDFLKARGLPYSSSKGDLLTKISIKPHDQEFDADFKKFLIDSVKYSQNRFVITAYVNLNYNSILNSGDPDVEDFKYIEDIFDINLLTDEYNLVYRDTHFDSGKLQTIEFIFGKKFSVDHVSNTMNEEIKERFDYVHITIDTKTNVLKMTYREQKNDDIGERHNITSFFERFAVAKLAKKYGFSIQEEDEAQTLYKIFRELTKGEEEAYIKRAKEMEGEVNDFIKIINEKFNFKDNSPESIEWSGRIVNLIARRLIRQNFDDFTNRDFTDGIVRRIRFIDAIGGSVDAAAGGRNSERDYDFQDSDVYFDIKDTIHIDKALKAISVTWKSPESLLPSDNRSKLIRIRYTVYKRFYVTHFENINIRKETFDYVLQKFDKYKRLPL